LPTTIFEGHLIFPVVYDFPDKDKDTILKTRKKTLIIDGCSGNICITLYKTMTFIQPKDTRALMLANYS